MGVIAAQPAVLTYRRIDPRGDADVAVRNYRDACVASFGNARRFIGASRYLEWLADRVEEYPEGHVLAMLGEQVVGQMELQVPYGLSSGYVNLFYVAEAFRGRGWGKVMHGEYAEKYFRSWEASRVELDVSPTNERAVGFYRSLGYRVVREAEGGRLWRMGRGV
jgi:ribosomal protein S18 acetylase RimI-like enzyme